MARKAKRTGPDEMPASGSVFIFATSPHNMFSGETGRFGALTTPGVRTCEETGETLLALALLDGLWTSPPAPQTLLAAPLLTFAQAGQPDRPAAFTMYARFWRPTDLRNLMRADVMRPDDALAQSLFFPARPIPMAMTLRYLNEVAEGEWRRRHDRAKFESELERLKAHRAQERAARDTYVKERLSGLTWERLLSETPFANWTPSPPAPPAAFVTAARAQIHDTCRALAALGRKPRKVDARRILKTCVLWFNAEDAAAGHVIETGEREDICTWLEEMAYVAGHPALADEVETWRDW